MLRRKGLRRPREVSDAKWEGGLLKESLATLFFCAAGSALQLRQPPFFKQESRRSIE
jgi:hypothetical protein